MADSDSIQTTESFLNARPSEKENSPSPSQQEGYQQQPALMDSSVISNINTDTTDSPVAQSTTTLMDVESETPSVLPSSINTDTMTATKDPLPAAPTSPPVPAELNLNPAMEEDNHSFNQQIREENDGKTTVITNNESTTAPVDTSDYSTTTTAAAAETAAAATTTTTTTPLVNPIIADTHVITPFSSENQHDDTTKTDTKSAYTTNTFGSTETNYQSSHMAQTTPSLPLSDTQHPKVQSNEASVPAPTSPTVIPKQEDTDTVMHDATLTIKDEEDQQQQQQQQQELLSKKVTTNDSITFPSTNNFAPEDTVVTPDVPPVNRSSTPINTTDDVDRSLTKMTETATTTTDTSKPPPPPPNTMDTTSGSSTNNNGVQNGYRPLNVKDALSYLDQVKVQFSEHPEVYNKFLDIMKDFKSQAIDTPGVIERVSSLFRGHPLLISGFNTFLPPGYCIECITDENNQDLIKVTTPTGTTTTNAGEPVRLGSETTGTPTHEQLYYGTGAGGYGYGGGRMGSTSTATVYTEVHGGPMTIHHLQHPGQHLPPSGQQSHHGMGHPHHQQQQPTHHLQHPPMAGQQQLHHPMDDGIGSRRPPVEFNHAINYVNKIKNRFSSDPDIYKQFLEILQTYQKEQRPIQEVYSQVQVLFNGDNDLLAEFKQFLPDTTGGPSSAVYTSTPHGKKGLMMIPGLPYVSQGRKKRVNTMMAPGLSKRSKLQNKLDTQTSEVRSGMSLEQEMARPFVSGEEVEFFEQVKKYIGSKATYNAFLKVLNLFSQQIVDQNVLVNRVEGFIGGNKSLFDMFKTLVGYDGKDEIVENIPSELGKPDLALCRACGPSYRLIPKSWEQSQICSGKDELCLEVLNDRYVSHPTWASEDSGYVTSKKNQYEEALHRVEEERYDYDLNIEANLNTIALLEPIMKKISAMNAEEKMDFTLAVGLGGPSKTIYQRIIKKIYGNEKGLQVIGLLHSSPAQTVPIVLRRLKQKDDEWKRAQREWNKIWREVEAKSYFKALDYQGITFKTNDKRRMTTKHLITEIEERRIQQQEEQHKQSNAQDVNTSNSPTLLVPRRKPSQFTFDFKQRSVIKDVMRLIYYFFERTELYSVENQDKMRTFMEILLPLVFDIETVIPDDPNDATTSTGVKLEEANGGREEATGMEEDGDEEGGMAEDGDGDDEAGDEADDEEDEETRSIQSFDSDDDTVMGNSKPSPSSRSTLTRGGKKSSNGNRRMLKDILTQNIRQLPTPEGAIAAAAAGSPSSSMTGNEVAAAAPTVTDTDATAQTDSENDSISKHSQTQQDMDVDVPEANDKVQSETVQTPDPSTESSSALDTKSISEKLPNDADSNTSTTNKRHVYNLFGDSEFYCFFRLYQMIYDRLCQMKSLDDAYKKNPTETKRELKAPLKLGSKSKRFADYQVNFSNGYYQALLNLIEKFFEGDVDQQSFEEISRYIFGNKAFVMFTIDKVILSLIRHTHVIVTNDKTSALLDLFKQDHDLEHVDAQTLGDYRLHVEDLVGKEEVLFNISFDTIRRTLSIQILGEDEDYEKSAGDNYEEYVSNYIDWANATKGINPLNMTPRFLKRNLNARPLEDEQDVQQKNLFVQSGMQYKICRDTYHMFYIIGTEDILMRLPSNESASTQFSIPTSSIASSSNTKWKSWLESEQGWSKGITNKEQAEKDARQLLFSNSP